MSYQRIVLLLIAWLISVPTEALGLSVVNLWISRHGAMEAGSLPPSNPNSVPEINRLAGSGAGSFYIWAKPAAGMNLANWSLDVRSSEPNAIGLTSSWVAPYNQSLNGIPSGPNSIRRWEFHTEPAVGDPNFPSSDSGELVNINGFSLFGDEGMGVGIGDLDPNGAGPDPYYSPATDTWLLARIDYNVGTSTGQSEIYLQIGSLGMSHCAMIGCDPNTANTEAIFGAITDPPLNALSDPNQDSATPDAILFVNNSMAPLADFDGDGDTDGDDLNIWEASYGLDGGGDADGDGDTDGLDFLAWQQLYTGSISPQSTVQSIGSAVPEPEVWMLFYLGLVGVSPQLCRTRFRCQRR